MHDTWNYYCFLTNHRHRGERAPLSPPLVRVKGPQIREVWRRGTGTLLAWSSLKWSSQRASRESGRCPAGARCPPQVKKCQAGTPQASCNPRQPHLAREVSARPKVPVRSHFGHPFPSPQPSLRPETGAHKPVRGDTVGRQRSLAGARAP